MIPIRDNIPSRRYPVVSRLLIAACGIVFVLQIQAGSDEDLVERYGMIPRRVLHPGEPVLIQERVPVQTFFGVMWQERVRPARKPPFPPLLTLLTCMFLHGGWLHFLGNMWFLHIFGDNVEDRLGRLGFLVFYLAAGLVASGAHLASSPESTVPTIGASGAIAGVMGAYLVLFPRSRVYTLLPLFIVFQIIVLPAPIFLGIWFLLQLFQGTLSISETAGGGVAWWAHIGGFVAGVMVAVTARAAGGGRRVTPWNGHGYGEIEP